MRQLDIHVVRFEGSEEDAVHGLESEFGLNHEAAVRFVQSVPRLARSGTAPLEAQAYQQVLKALGAVVELRPTLSLPTPGDLVVPSLPRPPVLEDSEQGGFDSSAALARRVPRAPAVPVEAWSRQRSGVDELGNPLPDPDSQPVKPQELRLRSWTAAARDSGHEYSLDGDSTWTAQPRSDMDPVTSEGGIPAHARPSAPSRPRYALWVGLALLAVASLGGLYLRVKGKQERPPEAPAPSALR